jgi:peptidoglycan/LPS O-acetylase OafA/YrhL
LGHYDIRQDPFLHAFVFHNAAVDIFFCLSAFTLCLVYGAGSERKLDLRRYAVARFARIYPLFFASLFLAAIYSVRWELWQSYPGFAQAVAGLFGQQLLLIGGLPFPGYTGFWNVPAWSISVEVACYIFVFPLLFWASSRKSRPFANGAGLIALSALAAAATFVAYALYFDPVVHSIGGVPKDAAAYWVGLARGALMFVSGWLIWLAYLRKDAAAAAAGALTDVIAILAIIIVLGNSAGLTNAQALVVLAPLLILGLMDPGSVTARVLGSRPVHFLGVISYAVYLLHLPCYNLALRFFPSLELSDGARIIVPLVATLALATASTYYFEQPVRSMIRRVRD